MRCSSRSTTWVGSACSRLAMLAIASVAPAAAAVPEAGCPAGHRARRGTPCRGASECRYSRPGDQPAGRGGRERVRDGRAGRQGGAGDARRVEGRADQRSHGALRRGHLRDRLEAAGAASHPAGREGERASGPTILQRIEVDAAGWALRGLPLEVDARSGRPGHRRGASGDSGAMVAPAPLVRAGDDVDSDVPEWRRRGRGPWGGDPGRSARRRDSRGQPRQQTPHVQPGCRGVAWSRCNMAGRHLVRVGLALALMSGVASRRLAKEKAPKAPPSENYDVLYCAATWTPPRRCSRCPWRRRP